MCVRERKRNREREREGDRERERERERGFQSSNLVTIFKPMGLSNEKKVMKF